MSAPALCAQSKQAAVYRRRHPEHTVLYRAIQEQLETWLERKCERNEGSPVPAWVEREFRGFLDCGVLARGFARARCSDCGHDFLIAFSCKGRGVCPSCNTRRMVEVAAHLVDHVFPLVPVRQWVLSLPRRLRFFVYRDAELAGRVLRVFLRAVEVRLRQTSPGAPRDARFGGVTFVQRFGAALNAHLHYHCCLIDGVFSSDGDDLRFHSAVALTEADVVAVQELVRNRVLSLFVRRGLLASEAAADMSQWEHGSGFSLDATIRIAAHDRAGLERLLRYCARPAFARERLEWADDKQEYLLYHLPRPWPDGQTVIRLDPLELLDRLAALIPPPRSHRHRYHGVLAPNARLRSAVTARAGLPVEAGDTEQGTAESSEPDSATAAPEVTVHPRCSSLWAALLARIYEVFPLVCPNCGSEMRIISFITRVDSIDRILSHIGETTTPPPIAPARAPPLWEFVLEQTPAHGLDTSDPVPEFEFDQRVSW
jgi:hypothetical protein